MLNDAISRTEVKKILSDLMDEAGKDGKLILSDAIEFVNELQSVVTDSTLKYREKDLVVYNIEYFKKHWPAELVLLGIDTKEHE